MIMPVMAGPNKTNDDADNNKADEFPN